MQKKKERSKTKIKQSRIGNNKLPLFHSSAYSPNITWIL